MPSVPRQCSASVAASTDHAMAYKKVAKMTHGLMRRDSLVEVLRLVISHTSLQSALEPPSQAGIVWRTIVVVTPSWSFRGSSLINHDVVFSHAHA